MLVSASGDVEVGLRERRGSRAHAFRRPGKVRLAVIRRPVRRALAWLRGSALSGSAQGSFWLLSFLTWIGAAGIGDGALGRTLGSLPSAQLSSAQLEAALVGANKKKEEEEGKKKDRGGGRVCE